MAYKIIGNVYQIYATENRESKNGGTFNSRSLVLIQRRFDPNTGEEYEPNYPQLDFAGNQCAQLDNFHQGDRVQVSFDVVGVKYTDQMGQEKFFSKLRAFKIEPYVVNRAQAPQGQPQAAQPAQPQYQGQPQGPQSPYPF